MEYDLRRNGQVGRVSVKKDKTVYQTARENLGYTREKASELLGWIAPERIERIESEKSGPHPDEVMAMAETYKDPGLCNYYCARECPIGQKYVPEIKPKDLSQIVLEMLASLNSMQKSKERLIEITADGIVSGDEIKDFIAIQEQLEKISVTVESLQIWTEKMLSEGKIDKEEYERQKKTE